LPNFPSIEATTISRQSQQKKRHSPSLKHQKIAYLASEKLSDDNWLTSRRQVFVTSHRENFRAKTKPFSNIFLVETFDHPQN
jgi:hypothetical protein